MTATKYTFSISADTATGVFSSDLFLLQIGGSAIAGLFKHVDTVGDVMDVWCTDELSSEDVATLDGLVAAHDGTGYEPPVESTRSENFIFTGSDTQPYQRIRKTQWQVAARVRFRGCNDMGVPLAVKAVMWVVPGGEAWARIYDVTNDALICEGGSTTAEESEVVDLGTIQNLPAGEAVWELQVKRAGGEGRVHSLSIDYL
jgi:hypothetical protein